MKRLAIIALSVLISASLFAQGNENLGKKYGNYEIKLTKDKWTSEAVVSGIWDNATGVWVTAPKLKNKEGSMVFLPNTSVEFIEGDRYVPEAQGLVVVGNGYRWYKGIDYPSNKWLIRGCGVFRIVDDKLVPILQSGDGLDVAYLWEARYIIFSVVPNHALILGSFHQKDKEGYSIFNLQGERLYNDLKDFKYKDEPSLKIQLEDGSWHHLDPADGSMID